MSKENITKIFDIRSIFRFKNDFHISGYSFQVPYQSKIFLLNKKMDHYPEQKQYTIRFCYIEKNQIFGELNK